MTDFIRQIGHHIRVRLSQILILVRVFGDIEQEVSDVLSTVRRGIEVLDLEQQPASGEQEE